ncbi:MAG: protein TolR [Methyloprofundus sp.]|nr:protein TolR [Methyloprofundus sp.]
MLKRKVRKKNMAEINVVPYIDVTLVLLIIFMITAPLIQSGVDVDLPQANTSPIDQDDKPTPIIISINKAGLYFIDLGLGDEESAVSAQEVLLLTAAVRQNKPETAVYIRGDKQVEYGQVVTVMAALKNAGIENVGLMTENF